jgi:hypothetical protein
LDEKIGLVCYKRKISEIKKFEELKKLQIDEKFIHRNANDARKKQQHLFESFYTYKDDAELRLERQNEENEENAKKEFKITEARVIAEIFKIIKEKGLWTGNKYIHFECGSTLIPIKKHGVVYQSGNNARLDFYKNAKGKVCWECINSFNANSAGFIPKWRAEGGNAIWSITQGDMLEMSTPNTWKDICKKSKCHAVITKFDRNTIGIVLMNDARADASPDIKKMPYMKRVLLEKGLSFFVKHKVRKIELTPFGKVKRKHKALG